MESKRRLDLRRSHDSFRSESAEHDFCSASDLSFSGPYPLAEIPPAGQYVRVWFGTGSEGWWRVLVNRVRDDGQIEYVTQASAGIAGDVASWPGGELLYSFQHCEDAVWVDYTQTGVNDTPVLDGCDFAAFSEQTDNPQSVVNISWGPEVGPASIPRHLPRFTISFDSFRIDNTRSEGTDTDYAVLAVYSPLQGLIGPLKKSMGDLNSGGPYGVGLKISNVAVPEDKGATIVWGVINSGHQTSEQFNNSVAALLRAAVQPAVDPDGGANANGQPQDTNFLRDFVDSLINLAVGFLLANCDGPVVAQRISPSGASLEAETANDTHTWNFPGRQNIGDTDFKPSPFGCRNSNYTSYIKIVREQLPPGV